MDSDEQWALSHKYTRKVGGVLALPSGRYALFNAERQLLLITEDVSRVMALIRGLRDMPEYPPPSRPNKSDRPTLEDLGL